MKTKIRRNITLFKLFYFLGDCWPLSALAIVYFQQITNSYASALGIFSIANITQTLLEVPTGIFSDKIGRKQTLCLSSFLFSICFCLFAYAGNINSTYLLILGGFFWGAAEAFSSGTEEALIYETMEELRKKDKYNTIYSFSKVFSQLGLAIGALLATIITYFYSLHILAWFSVIPALVHFVSTLFIIEPSTKNKKDEATTSISHFIKAFKKVAANKKLLNLSSIKTFAWAVSMSSHRLEGVYFNMIIPTWLVNFTRIIKQLSGALSFYIAGKLKNINFFKMLFLSATANVVVRFLGIILNNFATPFIFSITNIFYGPEDSAQSSLIQKELSSQERATMGSVISLAASLFQAIMYFIVGFIADATSVYIAIITLLTCKLITSIAYFAMFKKYK